MAVLSSGMEVVCDTDTDGGGWLVLQRRTSGDVDFYRSWEDYKYGCGDIYGGDFWFGLEKLHQLSFNRRYELRIDLTYNGLPYVAKYDNFTLFGEPEKYKIRVSGFSGNASDGLGYHSDRPFTTKDRDNDATTGLNCATKFHGAWWYGACHNSNLNGKWGSNVYAEGLTWHTLTGDHSNPTNTEMKIRVIN